MKKGNRFGEYIAKLRNEKQISQAQLSDGLCTVSMLSRFERGEREPEKLLQNRFLTRLGVVPENYENFLYYKEYCRWEKRQGIIHNILEENIGTAKVLLEEYRQEYKMDYALEKQFYLAMLAQIRRYEGCEASELAELFGTALLLTVPKLEQLGFSNRILSLEELNLLLEYYYCTGSPLKRYEELLTYIEHMERTLLAMAKIYPKTVYYYYMAWEKSGEQKELVNRMLSLCDRAIELLRNANRMFYLWEMFCMKERLIPLLPEEKRELPEVKKRLKEYRVWRETLEEIHIEFGVSVAMYEFCYLYVGSENYCIGDVIRIRRKMLGLSQKKLSEGICDERTVSKLERNRRKPQKEVVQQLFDRLNLSTELNRTELITDSQEAIEKYRQLQVECNNCDYEAVEKLINECRSLISMEIPSNRQLFIRNETLNQYNCGNLSKEEYVEGMKKALECTIPYERVVSSQEKYLTNEEIACIQNITLKMDWTWNEMGKCILVLKNVSEKPKYATNYLRMYEFIMAAVNNYWSKTGEYDCSDKVESSIIRLLLINRRLGGLHEALYEMAWNERQRINNGREKEMSQGYKQRLLQCSNVSQLCKDIVRTEIYIKKMNE